jgi:hypothetical protein
VKKKEDLENSAVHLLEALLTHNHGDLTHFNPIDWRSGNRTLAMPDRLQRGTALPGHGHTLAIGIQRAGVGGIGQKLSERGSLTAGYPEAVFHRCLLPAKKRNDISPYDTPIVALLVLVRTMGAATDPDVTGRNGLHRIYHLQSYH